MKSILTIILLLNYFISFSQQPVAYRAIYSGVPLFDDKGNTVSAHGACIVKDNGRYYLFGERHTDTSNAFAGFNCYSSADLYNWKFENIVLPVQDTGKLGPNRIGERIKVMKCPATGEYIMYMHVDTLDYRDQYIGYATSKTINGTYQFRGPLLFNDNPIRKWDMGTFQDQDGSGYLLIHGGDIYQLSNDYKRITEQVLKNMSSECESPAIFRKDSIYYWLSSHRTSWERNDNFYYTATSLKGPWISRGNFAPAGTLTWNSQTTFVFPIEGTEETTYMFMGDRWSFPKQASAATYVWQPLRVSGTALSIPDYQKAWTVNTVTGKSSFFASGILITPHSNKKLIAYSGDWIHASSDSLPNSRSDSKNAYFSLNFTGRQIEMYAMSRPDGGYALITLQNSKRQKILSSIIDMYCNYTESSLKFLSPFLPKDNYTLTVTVLGERGNWTDKRKNNYGSTGNFVSVYRLGVRY